MRLRLFFVSVVVGVVAGACAPPPLVVSGGGQRAELETAPFVVRFVDEDSGAEALELVGVHEAVDFFYLEPQLLPGWDGYREAVDEWRTLADVTEVRQQAERIEVDLAGPDGAGATVVVTGGGVDVRAGALLAGAPHKLSLSFRVDDEASFFGLGESFGALDHRGQDLYLWSEEGGLGQGEHAPAGRVTLDGGGSTLNPAPNGPSMTYFPVPFLLGAPGDARKAPWGMYLDSTRRLEVHAGSERAELLRVAVSGTSEGASLPVRIYVDDPLDAIARYVDDTGHPPVPAPWVWGPRKRTGVHDTIDDGTPEWQALRERGVRTTGIDDATHFLPHLSQTGREEELAAWTAAMHEQGFKVMAYNNPYVSLSDDNADADQAYGEEHDLFLEDDVGNTASTFFISGHPQQLATIDLTTDEAVAWFQQLLSRTLDLGYDGWMHDFGEYTERAWRANNGMTGEELHNLFPVLSARAAFELLEERRPNDYLFFVRSGWAGTQAVVPAVWGGDAEATFDETQGLPSALRSGVNLGMSGVPYWGSDGTGFKCITTVDDVDNGGRDKEIYLRWLDLMATSPIFMEQNACSNPLERRTKWHWYSDDETTRHYADMARLHTRLAPYFDVLAQQAHARGTPIMRHPWLVYPRDVEARAVDEAFFLGDALFAAPVVRRGQTVKRTWAPPGPLVDVLDGTLVARREAGVVDLDAPLGKLPLLLLPGHVLPLLDERVDTLAPATDPDVIDAGDAADRLDAVVALLDGQRASIELVDGTRLSAVRDDAGADDDDGDLQTVDDAGLAECARCARTDRFGEVDRVRANSALAASDTVRVGGVTLRHEGGPARRLRWTVLLLDG